MKFNFRAAEAEFVRSCDVALKVGAVAGAIILLTCGRYPMVFYVGGPVFGVALVLAMVVPPLYAGFRRAP